MRTFKSARLGHVGGGPIKVHQAPVVRDVPQPSNRDIALEVSRCHTQVMQLAGPARRCVRIEPSGEPRQAANTTDRAKPGR